MSAFVDWVMDFLYALAWVAIGWLPDSPFQIGTVSESLANFSEIMSYINYFVPINWMVNILATYVSAAAIWYVARWVLRLTQYID